MYNTCVIYNISVYIICQYTCDVLRDLVPFVQSEKRKKHPWGSVTFSFSKSLQLY